MNGGELSHAFKNLEKSYLLSLALQVEWILCSLDNWGFRVRIHKSYGGVLLTKCWGFRVSKHPYKEERYKLLLKPGYQDVAQPCHCFVVITIHQRSLDLVCLRRHINTFVFISRKLHCTIMDYDRYTRSDLTPSSHSVLPHSIHPPVHQYCWS